jgi:hypothetical protein
MAKRAARRPAPGRGKRTKPAAKAAARKSSGKRQKSASRRPRAATRGSKATARSGKASSRKAKAPSRKAGAASRKKTRAARSARSTRPARLAPAPGAGKSPRLDRARRTLDDASLPTPPSSLNLDRHSSAARSGRAEMLDNQRKEGKMRAVTGGDVDVDAEDAYFTGEEAPGGDNPTPDQDIVDDIGKALGVEYQDGEELQASDKVARRDKHRWELDPASSEDYKGRK